MKKKRVLIAISFLFLFTIFSWGIKRGAFRNADFAFTVKLQEAIDKSPRLRFSRFVGDVMEGSTFVASPEISIVFIIFITFIIFIKTKKDRWLTLAIPILFALLILAELYGKTVVHHPAPPFFMIKNPTSVFPKYYINEQFSYPSGHAARAVFLSSLFSYLLLHTSFLRRKTRMISSIVVCVVYIGLVSISRIYLGHHWLSDVMGGWLVGGGMAGLTVAILSIRTDG